MTRRSSSTDDLTKTNRPHWVKAMDQGLTHTSYPEYWNRNIKGDVSEENWKNSKKNAHHDKISTSNNSSKGSVARGNHRGYREHTGSGLYRSHHSDTASLTSRVTSSSDRRQRKRSRRLACFLVLLILAFLLAALLGWLMYYLLMRGTDPRHDRVLTGPQSTNASMSMRVLNKDYTPNMADNSSAEFKSMADKLCREVDGYFHRSNLSEVYIGCAVERIRNVIDDQGCKCYGTKMGNLLIDFHLAFNGSHDKDNIRWTIYDVMEDGSTKHYKPGVIYLYVDEYLVDIRVNWFKAYDGIQAEVMMPVFNLNYSYMLGDRTSLEFTRLADPFCDEVSVILATKAISPFRNRYYSCRVSNFKTRPNRITFHVNFRGKESRSIQQKLIYVLLTGASDGTVMQQPVKMIGPLAVTPWSYNIDFTIIPINISSITTQAPTTPSPTTPRTTPSTTPRPKLIYAYSIYPTYNLTLTPELLDPTSVEFKEVTRKFCDDLRDLYDQSIYGYRYYNCTVYAFRSNPTSIVVSVGYLGDPWPQMDTSTTWVIRSHAPKFYFDLKEVYLVGGIYLILGEVKANGLELRTSLLVLNLTYTMDLADQRSPRFRYHADRFCRDMAKFYYLSYLKDRFYECGVDQFTNNPVQIHFYLVFMGTDMTRLPESVVDVIRFHAPPFYYQIHLAYLVGELLVLPERLGVDPSIYPTNITAMSSTSTSTQATSSTRITSTLTSSMTEVPTPTGIKLILFYEVYNLTFTNDLKDPNSVTYLRHKYAVCDDLWRWYMARTSPFLNIYRECDVTSFTSDPTGVTFTLLFETKLHETFTRDVRVHLENYAPKVYVPGLNLLDVGHLLLIMDRYTIVVTTTTVPSQTLMPPSRTTSSIVSTSFSMTSTVKSVTPTKSSSVTSTYRPPAVQVILNYGFGLADFVFTPDLNDRNSPRFQFLQRRFCKDIDSYYINSSMRDYYVSCRIDGFTQRPNAEYPEKVYFSFTFNTEMFYEIEQRVAAILLQKPPRVARSGYLTLNVGDLFLIIDSFTTVIPDTPTSRIEYTPRTTVVSTPSDLFASTPTITLSPSPTTTSTTSSTATTTTATTPTSSSISPSPTTPSKPSSSVTPTPSPTTPSSSNSTQPTYFIRMSFETLNLTREPWLSNPQSPEFIQVEQYFCADLDKILNDHERFYPKFINCEIDSFGGDPLRVNFSLQFRDLKGKSRSEVKDLVVSMLIENAIRKEYNGVYALLVGNLLIALSSITVEFSTLPPTSNMFNAIAYDYTFYVYPANFSTDLLEHKSAFFNVTAYRFCQDVDELFANVGLRTIRSRYYGCAVNGFGPNGEINFTITLRDTDSIRPSTMINIFVYSGDQVYLDTVFYQKLGDLYYSVDTEPSFYLLQLETFTTHAYPYTTTTAPNVNTIITLTLDVLQPNWSIDLMDTTSARYRLLAESFCSAITPWISEWNSDFIRCGNVRFSRNPFQITTELIFRGIQESTLENFLKTIIVEKADWVRVDNMYAMAIGSMIIYDQSLVLSQRTVSIAEIVSTPAPIVVTVPTNPTSPTTPITTPAPTTASKPCAGAANRDYAPHPSLCDRFYRCIGGQGYLINCPDGFVYQGSTCVQKPPGFVCQR